MPRVRILESFRADVRAQIAWIRRHREASWISGLREGLREARSLLAGFPGAGVLIDERAGVELRKLVLRRLPFNLHYASDGKDVWLVRLFHHRQRR